MLISDVSRTTGTGTAKAVHYVRSGAPRMKRCPYVLGFGVSCFHTYVERFSGATVAT